MSEQKISPKLIELCKWTKINEVNQKLDNGETPNSVCSFINRNGFQISAPYVYEYAKIRKKALVDGINMEKLIGVVQPNASAKDFVTQTATNKLRSEIDALDMIIQQGYETLKQFQDRPIAPKLMMDAIKLKNDLTEGNHGFLTNYGIEQLRLIEQNKYQLIIEHLVSYIPESVRKVAVDQIEVIEDEFYQKTEYYSEYLKAKGYSDSEIQQRLNDLQRKMDEIENAG